MSAGSSTICQFLGVSSDDALTEDECAGDFSAVKVSAPAPLTMQERLQACGWTGEVYRLID